MDSFDQNKGKKRALQHISATELAYKLKSKTDFMVYLDKHRK